MAEKTVIVTHEKYLENYPTARVECPERLKSMLPALEDLPCRTPEPATDQDILRVHTPGYHNDVKNSPVYEVAMLSAGGAILAGEIGVTSRPAFAAIRPPGHHASPNNAWGFCFFNNMSVTIEKLREEKKIDSAFILDIDLHFGDGTDNFYRGDKNVTVWNVEETRPGPFLDCVHRGLAEREYDIIGVSAGFDTYEKDWGGILSTGDYYRIGRMVCEAAREKCNGRRFAILEGGYYLEDLGHNVRAFIEGMQGDEAESDYSGKRNHGTPASPPA